MHLWLMRTQKTKLNPRTYLNGILGNLQGKYLITNPYE
jgi:hypothetical protein